MQPRIVSLLPSTTEIVCELGLVDQLVGVTHECDYPPAVRGKPKATVTHIPVEAASDEIDRLVRAQLAGGRALYALDFEMLSRLAPDLIVTQTLCDVCAVDDREVQEAACRLPGPPRVVHLEPTRLEEVLDSILTVGAAAGVQAMAELRVTELRARIEAVRVAARLQASRARVVVLEWLDPLFSCGHWTPELVQLAGGVEPLAEPGQRSRQLSAAELVAADPDAIVIACCGYSLERTLQDGRRLWQHLGVADRRCVRAGRIYAVDGSAYFSRPGPRLVDSLEILANALDQRRHPLPAGLTPARHVRLSNTAR